MSDTEVMSTQKATTGKLRHAILVLMVMIACSLAMSKDILAGSATIHYDTAEREEIPSAAARLCKRKCERLACGCAYTFHIEVFDTCWKPVYAIEMETVMDGLTEPLSCPENWEVTTMPSGSMLAGSVVFYTDDHPIQPGTVQTGFGLVSYSGSMSLRWGPADQKRILIGKMSRLDFSCPTGTEPASWGSIKAIYR